MSEATCVPAPSCTLEENRVRHLRHGRAGWRSCCRHFVTGTGLTQLAKPLSKAERGEPVFHFKIAPDKNSQGVCSLCNLRESKALLWQCIPGLWSSPASFRASGQGWSPGGGRRGPGVAALPAARRRVPGAGTSTKFCRKPNTSSGKHAADFERIPTSSPNPAAACLANKTPCGF